MPRPILTLLLLLACLGATTAHATEPTRVAGARIARISTSAATLHDVRVRLEWAPGAAAGELSLQAALVEAPGLGYRYRDLHWHCPLQRARACWCASTP